MPVAFTFGAVGDIIAVSHLLYLVLEALLSSTGSSRTCQALIAELDLFKLSLDEVEKVLSPRAPHRLQFSAENAIKGYIELCRYDLDAFLRNVGQCRKKLLGGGGSWRMAAESWRKIGWALIKGEEIERLAKRLKTHRENIMLIFTLSGFRAAKGAEAASKEISALREEIKSEYSNIRVYLEQLLHPLSEKGYGRPTNGWPTSGWPTSGWHANTHRGLAQQVEWTRTGGEWSGIEVL